MELTQSKQSKILARISGRNYYFFFQKFPSYKNNIFVVGRFIYQTKSNKLSILETFKMM